MTTFKEFTDFEWLLIALANAHGQDKALYEDRIAYVKAHAKDLGKQSFIDQADDKQLYVRALIELENIRKGKTNSGFMMGLDGTASGLQCLSVLSGCIQTASQVGLVDPNKRCDAYTAAMDGMNEFLPQYAQIVKKLHDDQSGYTRDDVKQALMTHYYGSVLTPMNVFGYGSQHYVAFYEALRVMFPGAEILMNGFLGAINPQRTQYRWDMPDGFNAICNVIAEDVKTIEIAELPNVSGNHSTFSHISKSVGTNQKYVATAANVTHSVDSFVVREMHRRMKHDKSRLERAYKIVESAKAPTSLSTVPTLRAVDWILDLKQEPTENQAGQLKQLIEQVICNESAPLVTIHDEFKSYPRMMNTMRKYYNEILASIAESTMCEQISRQLYNNPNLEFGKLSDGNELATLIRGANYSIC